MEIKMINGRVLPILIITSLIVSCKTIYKPTTFISDKITNHKAYAINSNYSDFGALSNWYDASAGGMYGGLIVNVHQNEVDKRYYQDYAKIMSPIFEEVNNEQIKIEFDNTIMNSLSQFNWLDTGSLDKKNYANFNTTYYFNHELTRLVVTTEVSIYSNKMLPDSDESILVYSNSFSYVSSSIGEPPEYKAEISKSKSIMQKEIEKLKAGWTDYAAKKKLSKKQSISEKNKKIRKIKEIYDRTSALEARAKYWALDNGSLIHQKLNQSRQEIADLIALGFQEKPNLNALKAKIDKNKSKKPSLEQLSVHENRIYAKAINGKSNLGSYCSFEEHELELFLSLGRSASIGNNQRAPRCLRPQNYYSRPYTIGEYNMYKNTIKSEAT